MLREVFAPPAWQLKYQIVPWDRALQQVREGHFPSLEAVPPYALTLTIPALLAPAKILCLAPEQRKAVPVRNLVQGPVSTACPASILRTAPHATFANAAKDLIDGRLAVASLLEQYGMAMGITGCHPFSRWQDQHIIDTPHYRLVEEELGYVAWTNNTWALHVHCGVRGADRAIAVATRMRSVLPDLLALSANSSSTPSRVALE